MKPPSEVKVTADVSEALERIGAVREHLELLAQGMGWTLEELGEYLRIVIVSREEDR